MRIPKELKIGGHQYQIKMVSEFDKCGVTNRDKGTISISSELPRSQREATLIHEILHAINNELDHALLDSLSEQLYQVLSDNKMLR
jgi:hypothetical protein